MEQILKKTPEDTSELDREQLRFLLRNEKDVSSLLSHFNPSLAWLPIIAGMLAPGNERQLAVWVERNLADPEAVREVAANIRLFGAETAVTLELGLDKATDLSPLLLKSWRLVIRHMRTVNRTWLDSRWFGILRRLRRGDESPEIMEAFATALRPSPRVGKRISFYKSELTSDPQRPSDLISIDYEVDEGVDPGEALQCWPKDVAAEKDYKLLRLLTHALSAALDDAIYAEVEGHRGYGTSDSDVPSIAPNRQNEYHRGFLPIVRVMSDLWIRLAQKDPALARQIFGDWQASGYRLMRRLALFAAVDPVISEDAAAQALVLLPRDELFLAGSSVEVYRLLRARWSEFPEESKRQIEERAAEGPNPDAFIEGSERDRAIDRSRFELLGALQRFGGGLNANAESVWNDIRERWPQWELRPEEQWGFHVWSEGVRVVVADASKLEGVSDEKLIVEAQRLAQIDLFHGDSLGALAKSDPARVLRGLKAQAANGSWQPWAWRSLLWAAENVQDASIINDAAALLLTPAKDQISEISYEASWWLNEKARALDDGLVWALWDSLEAAAPRNIEMSQGDALTSALNATPGKLAEVVLKKSATTKAGKEAELADDVRRRLEILLDEPGVFGRLARVRLAVEVSILFDRAPNWVTQRIVPLFDWSSPDAPFLWDARKYSNYIGSPKLFELTKEPFLAIFKRTDTSEEEMETFSTWLVVIILANRTQNAGYPLTPAEVRSALRQAGPRGLQSVGHRLAIELERIKPEEKLSVWKNLVGPVFQSIWPLDVDLQTPSLTFKLVQILRASGSAFAEAAGVIIPFIRPEPTNHATTVFSIAEADDVLYSSAPDKMLDLLVAVVGDAEPRSVYSLEKALSRVVSHAPQIKSTKKFQRLSSLGISLA